MIHLSVRNSVRRITRHYCRTLKCGTPTPVNFMWKDYYNTRYIRDAHGLIWIMDVDGQPGTMVPLCAPEDLKHYFEVAQAYFNECLGTKMILYLADKEAVDLLQLDTTRYEGEADRRYFDGV